MDRLLYSQVLPSPLLTSLFPTATCPIPCTSHHQSCGACSCTYLLPISDMGPLLSLTDASSCLKRRNSRDLFCSQSVEICRGISLSVSSQKGRLGPYVLCSILPESLPKQQKQLIQTRGTQMLKGLAGKLLL